MECKRLFLFLTVIILGLISGEASATRPITRRSMLLGGYMPITNPEDPYVQSIARFAVSEHDSESSDNLSLVEVVSGEQQDVDGINYKLVITAIDGDEAEQIYLAEVYVNLLQNQKKLNSFQLLHHRH